MQRLESLLEERLYEIMKDKTRDDPSYDCTFTTSELNTVLKGYREMIVPYIESEVRIEEIGYGTISETVFVYNGQTWDYEGTETNPLGI